MLERVTVYVADDHPLFLDGLTKAIRARPELELVGSSDDGRVALSDIVDLAPAVAVLDLRMPTLDGLRVLNALRRDGLPTAPLILSAHVESTLVYEALAAGARGYLSKLTSEQAVCEAIGAVARGETVLPPEVQPALLEEIRRRGTPDRPLLSDREHEPVRERREREDAENADQGEEAKLADPASSPARGRRLGACATERHGSRRF